MQSISETELQRHVVRCSCDKKRCSSLFTGSLCIHSLEQDEGNRRMKMYSVILFTIFHYSQIFHYDVVDKPVGRELQVVPRTRQKMYATIFIHCLQTESILQAIQHITLSMLHYTNNMWIPAYQKLTFSHQPTITHFGARSFAVAGPKAWSQLLADIRAIDSVNSFKCSLKTFLFRWLFV